MVEIGYALICEEHTPAELVRNARSAEEAGFGYALLSDHYHPWVPRQGNAPFAWTVVGGIATQTQRLRLGTGVTCPTIRYHPAIVAQAAATAASLMPGRFFLGLGSGENLNEHVVGAGWPATDVRHDMLEEAVGVIRRLFTGEQVTHRGTYFDVEDARLYTRPEEPPPIVVAASGSEAAELAGRVGDGLVGLAPSADLLETFAAAGGDNKPRYGQVTVCWAEDEDEAAKTALERWPQTGLKDGENTELRTPEQFEQASALVTADVLASKVALGPDPSRHIEFVDRFVDAGYDHVYLHQIGPDQEGFFRFCAEHIMPRYR